MFARPSRIRWPLLLAAGLAVGALAGCDDDYRGIAYGRRESRIYADAYGDDENYHRKYGRREAKVHSLRYSHILIRPGWGYRARHPRPIYVPGDGWDRYRRRDVRYRHRPRYDRPVHRRHDPTCR